jgi:aspartate/methionine/tyrosine aminotransferase
VQLSSCLSKTCLNETGVVSCRKPAGTFYAFPNIAKSGPDSKTVAQRLLTEAKVATVPGVAFGKRGEGHIRLNPESNVTKFYHRMAKKKGDGKAIVATSTKLLKIAYWLLKENHSYHS